MLSTRLLAVKVLPTDRGGFESVVTTRSGRGLCLAPRAVDAANAPRSSATRATTAERPILLVICAPGEVAARGPSLLPGGSRRARADRSARASRRRCPPAHPQRR